MNKLLLATTVALVIGAGYVSAQTTTTSQTTTTVTPAAETPLLVPPPVGTLSTTLTHRTVAADGTQTERTETIYRNTAGVADDSVTRTTTPAPMVETTTRVGSTTTTVIETIPVVPTCPPHNKYDAKRDACVFE